MIRAAALTACALALVAAGCRRPPRAALAAPAARCAECHPKMHAEWSASAHARAARAPLYLAMRGRAGTPSCDRCHAPLAAASPELGADGVTCDFCHAVRDVTPGRAGGDFAIDRTAQRGPLCDARDTSAHASACSPLHEEARLCGGCHLLWGTSPTGTPLPFFTEFEEWRDGPYAAMGVPCQDCHMAEEGAEAARGAGRREVPHHGLLGPTGDLRRRALTCRLWVADEAGRVRIDFALNNEGAGHFVPTGLPERRLVVRARVRDAAGREVARGERMLGRVLVDEKGNPAPFFAAVRVASDDRLPPKATRLVSLLLDGAEQGEVQAEVAWLEVAPEVAASLGLPPPAEQLLLEARLPFGPRLPAGGHAQLPASRFVKGR